MLKYRIILVVASVILIAVLFSLPKIVVDNEPGFSINGGQEPTSSELEEKESSAIDQHQKEMSAEDRKKLDKLRESFYSGLGEARIAYADSMAALFQSHNKFDSAARYLEYIATERTEVYNLEEAGNAYYEAFTFAMDRQKASTMGQKARHFYELVLEQQPERLEIRNKIAMTYVSSANPMQGITMLRQILEEDPDNEMALNNLGILSIQSGQYERAREYFEKLVSINPENIQGQFYLGLSYFELGEKQLARKQFELVKSLEDDPAVIATAEGYLQELN